MAEMFGVSTQTIKQAQNLDENKNPFIHLKYAVGVTCEKVTPDQKKTIEDYWFSRRLLIDINVGMGQEDRGN